MLNPFYVYRINTKMFTDRRVEIYFFLTLYLLLFLLLPFPPQWANFRRYQFNINQKNCKFNKVSNIIWYGQTQDRAIPFASVDRRKTRAEKTLFILMSNKNHAKINFINIPWQVIRRCKQIPISFINSNYVLKAQKLILHNSLIFINFYRFKFSFNRLIYIFTLFI